MKKIFFVPLFFSFFSALAQEISQAENLLYYKKFESAEDLLRQILKAEPENDQAWYLLSEAQHNLSDKPGLETELQSVPETVKDEPYYLVANGKILLDQSNVPEADKYFEQALEKTKYKNPEILLAVAKAIVESEKGDANHAIDLLNKAIKRNKYSAELYTELGKAYRKLNNGTEAFKAFRQAIEADKNFAEAYYLTGMIFRSQKNPELYLEYFRKAITADPKYAPAYYQLYHHYYFRIVDTAKGYLEKYIALSDHKIENDYDYADILYLTKNYAQAIELAKKIIEMDKENMPARIYKLIAYSYQESGEHQKAFDYLQQYFAAAPDTVVIAKDFVFLADLYKERQDIDSAIYFFKSGAALESDTASLIKYYKTIADLAKQQKDYAETAAWLGKFYQTNIKATNVDLFNWGIALYQAHNYEGSDSVFSLYAEKYPEQEHGYYWRARNNAIIDSSMEQSLAIPYYLKVIEIGQLDSTGNSKKHLIEAYGYLAGYEANKNKDYAKAIEYFETVLQLDPENKQAQKYVQILRQAMDKKEPGAAKTSDSLKRRMNLGI